jgi:transcriptional regulator with XRE-family HTH domain
MLAKFRQANIGLAGHSKAGQNGEYARMSNRLREFRKRAGFTQEALAAKAGVGGHHITRVELGTRNLTRDLAETLAPILNATWWELLGAPAPTGMAESRLPFTPAPPIASHPEPDPDEVLATIQEAVAAALTDLRLPNTQSDILRVSRAVERDIRAIDGIASFPATLDLRLSEAMTKLQQKWQAAKASL